MSDFAKEIISVNIEDELKQSYLSYALSVIHGRALPDIRDGLKPFTDVFYTRCMILKILTTSPTKNQRE